MGRKNRQENIPNPEKSKKLSEVIMTVRSVTELRRLIKQRLTKEDKAILGKDGEEFISSLCEVINESGELQLSQLPHLEKAYKSSKKVRASIEFLVRHGILKKVEIAISSEGKPIEEGYKIASSEIWHHMREIPLT
ncbi:MAG: hypothetical protein ABH833_00605 [Parcubacteria group bacterium]